MDNNYHEYVFKDNQLVGDFDNMYKNCDDPWYQSKRSELLEIQMMKNLLFTTKYDRVLDLGCGLGSISNIIKQNCNILDACDVSETAIQKATTRYPGINFFQHDILSKTFPYDTQYDLIILSGTLWYVILSIDDVFLKIKNLLVSNGEFFLTLPFPDITKDFYGNNIISNEFDLLNKFNGFFTMTSFIVLKDKGNLNCPTVQIKGFKNE